MKHISVIGGGIIGLMSAILLKNQQYEVTLIEQNEKLGGLLQSSIASDGLFFDYGTHIPRETGVKEIDTILFGSLNKNEWNIYDYLKVGNYFEGKLNKDSQFIDATLMDSDVFVKGFFDLLHTTPIEDSVNDADTYLEQYFGETFKREIFAPILEKLYGKKLCELHKNAPRLFGYTRIICGNQFLSSNFKKSAFFDDKLANTSNKIGISGLKSYYPKIAGIYKFVEELEILAIRTGVNIMKKKTIKSIELDGRMVKDIVLSDGLKLQCDHLIWTIPLSFLMNIIDVDYQGSIPQFKSVGLFNYEFDSPFLVDNHYIYCNDSSYKTFRITLYANLVAPVQSSPYTCTVEILGDFNEVQSISEESVIAELLRMNIISSKAKVLFNKRTIIKNGFPIMTNNHFDNAHEIEEIIHEKAKNISVVGKNSNKSFFMEESLRDAYEILKKEELI
ncbi:NAD(P)-binding protein [Viridibacillus arvi]|uniref:NAD(P)-binding protein n=1 Tax=Viridibacillus arvi TaxID=263475 RepID=UPI003D093929